ncbi:EF-hand [Poronia punctata]|nr:EF-hand [Poronia punctata]
MSMSSVGYKPSPLGYGSPRRSSPFRRPESSPSPSSPSTPTVTNSKSPLTPSSSSRLVVSPSNLGTPRRLFAPPSESNNKNTNMAGSRASTATGQTITATTTTTTMMTTTTTQNGGNGLGYVSDLSRLQPPQVRMLRDGFQILDRDGDGVVTRQDVADMLAQLGLPTDPSEFFPPGSPQTMTLASFLSSIARALAALSPGPELLAAFSAFDDDDSGQADLTELRDALLRTAPEPGERGLDPLDVEKVVAGFSGRRAFSKGGSSSGGGTKRGEVFRYREFVGSVVGGSGGGGSGANREKGEDEEGESEDD